MSIAALIRRMADAGASPEAIAIAVEAIEAEQAKVAERRSQAAERKARQRSRERDSHVTVTGQSEDIPSPKKETSPTPPKEKTTPSSSEAIASSLTPRAELEIVLDAKTASAVLDHRQRIRKPLTAHAAKLLAGKFRRCDDPNAAADAMIANGWQGFEPEWLASRTSQRSTSPPQPRERSVSDVLSEIAAGTWTGPKDHRNAPQQPFIETSFVRRN